MAFLLDSNTLIQAKNQAYGFDICPGFWALIEREHRLGNLYSVKKVLEELKRGADDLEKWAVKMDAGFFVPPDGPTAVAMGEIATWVQDGNFTDAAKRTFFSSADQYLVAYAKAHGHRVVSHEKYNPDQRNNVKIPVVCRAMDVDCMQTWDWIRALRARFVLE